MPETMTNELLTRYAAIEDRLPPEFPRLADHGIIYDVVDGWVRELNEHEHVPLTEADRGWFAVLVLRAGGSWSCLRCKRAVEILAEKALLQGDESLALDVLMIALESAYPETPDA